jgi:predicted PurR-regulated permease PerM
MLKLTVYVKSVLQLLALAGLAWLLYTVRGLIIYLIVAALLALVAKPLTNLLSSFKIKWFRIPRALSAIITLMVIVGVFVLISRLLVPSLVTEVASLSKIDFGQAYETLSHKVTVAEKWLANYEIELEAVEDDARKAITGLLSFKTAEQTIAGLLGGLGNIVIALFSITFILFFFLKEPNITGFILNDLFSEGFSKHLRHILPKLKRTLFRYAIGLLLQMTGIFTIVYVGLSLVGVESALVIAVFAAFFNLIPYVGPSIGAIFGLILGLGQAFALDPTISFGFLALKIVAVFASAQLTDNFVFQPLIFSNSINAHPLEIFIVISVAGLLGGVLGMVIAVPTYSMIRIVSKEFYANSKFIQAVTRNV